MVLIVAEVVTLKVSDEEAQTLPPTPSREPGTESRDRNDTDGLLGRGQLVDRRDEWRG